MEAAHHINRLIHGSLFVLTVLKPIKWVLAFSISLCSAPLPPCSTSCSTLGLSWRTQLQSKITERPHDPKEQLNSIRVYLYSAWCKCEHGGSLHGSSCWKYDSFGPCSFFTFRIFFSLVLRRSTGEGQLGSQRRCLTPTARWNLLSVRTLQLLHLYLKLCIKRAWRSLTRAQQTRRWRAGRWRPHQRRGLWRCQRGGSCWWGNPVRTSPPSSHLVTVAPGGVWLPSPALPVHPAASVGL